MVAWVLFAVPTAVAGFIFQEYNLLPTLTVNRPTMVLGDEPTGAVDSETSAQLAAIMRRMNRQHQVTFVLVTHDLDLAAETDRVIKLKDGRVISDETTAPASVAV